MFNYNSNDFTTNNLSPPQGAGAPPHPLLMQQQHATPQGMFFTQPPPQAHQPLYGQQQQQFFSSQPTHLTCFNGVGANFPQPLSSSAALFTAAHNNPLYHQQQQWSVPPPPLLPQGVQPLIPQLKTLESRRHHLVNVALDRSASHHSPASHHLSAATNGDSSDRYHHRRHDEDEDEQSPRSPLSKRRRARSLSRRRIRRKSTEEDGGRNGSKMRVSITEELHIDLSDHHQQEQQERPITSSSGEEGAEDISDNSPTNTKKELNNAFTNDKDPKQQLMGNGDDDSSAGDGDEVAGDKYGDAGDDCDFNNDDGDGDSGESSIQLIRSSDSDSSDADHPEMGRNFRMLMMFSGRVRDDELPPNCTRPQSDKGRTFPAKNARPNPSPACLALIEQMYAEREDLRMARDIALEKRQRRQLQQAFEEEAYSMEEEDGGGGGDAEDMEEGELNDWSSHGNSRTWARERYGQQQLAELQQRPGTSRDLLSMTPSSSLNSSAAGGHNSNNNGGFGYTSRTSRVWISKDLVERQQRTQQLHKQHQTATASPTSTITLLNNGGGSVQQQTVAAKATPTRTAKRSASVPRPPQLKGALPQPSPPQQAGTAGTGGGALMKSGSGKEQQRFHNRSLHIHPGGKRTYAGSKECFQLLKNGHCMKGAFCEYDHDGSGEHREQKLCSRLLRGLCRNTTDDCPEGPHSPLRAHQMPVCVYFLQMRCALGRDQCPYLHVKHTDGMEPCEEFNKGCCQRGVMCNSPHRYRYHRVKEKQADPAQHQQQMRKEREEQQKKKSSSAPNKTSDQCTTLKWFS